MHTAGNAPRPAHPPATTVLQPRTLLLATDLQQSILAELDRSGPNLRAYTAYGSPGSLRPTNAGLGFNGQLHERPTGWYHLGNGHRVYNPVLMRFHSPDRLSPFGEGGLNPYAYCSGSPMNRVDPSGKAWFALLGNAISTGLNMIFAGAAINRAAASIVSGVTPTLRMRVGNVFSFWGGAASVPLRAVGVPAAATAGMPGTVMALVSNAGVMAGQSSTGIGAVLQNSVSAGQWWGAAAKNGQSRGRVLWEATKEASGWNLLRGQAPRQVPGRAPDVPLREVVVSSPDAPAQTPNLVTNAVSIRQSP